MRRRLGSVLALAAFALSGCRFPGLLVPEGDLLHAVHLRGSPAVPSVALTFDDGPNGRCTADVLDALAATGVPATFFVLGANVDAGGNDQVLARMVREGHTIGLHGYHHQGKMLVSGPTLRDELRRTSEAIRAALARAGAPAPPAFGLFRPPFGFLVNATADAAVREGYAIVLWTVSVGDWQRGTTADEIVERILARVAPGDVIVLHDGERTHQDSRTRCPDRDVVAPAVRLLVPALAARGLRVVPLGELLQLTDGRPASGSGR